MLKRKRELGLPADGLPRHRRQSAVFRAAGQGPHRRRREGRHHHRDRTPVHQIHDGSLLPDGRCGVIVPEGVLFGSTGAHKELRRQLIENNRVEAVLSLPGGVFSAVFRGQDLGAVQEGWQYRARAVPARRQRRLQARRQPRHVIEADDLPALAEISGPRAALGRMAGTTKWRRVRFFCKVVVRRCGHDPRQRL
jgi:hypothetical protein